MPYRLLLGIWICLVIVVTTYPWTRFVSSIQWHRINWIPFDGVPILPGDIVANIFLFFPFGFLVIVAHRHSKDINGLGLAIFASFGLSLSVEIIQGFSLARFPSATDVIFNMVGGGGGALLALWWLKGSSPSASQDLALSNLSPHPPSKPPKS